MRKVYIIWFACLCGFGGINQITQWVTFPRMSENRNFAEWTRPDLNHLDAWLPTVERYLADNFSFRTPLIQFNHLMKSGLLGVSPDPENLVLGKEGWCFLGGDEQKIYQGKLDFSDSVLQAFEREWESRMQFLSKRSVKAYWMIPPSAWYVYEDFVPFQIRKSPRQRRTEVLADHLNEKYPSLVIDPLSALRFAADTLKVYYQKDNHWNYVAGWVASKALLEQIRADFPSVGVPKYDDYRWKDTLKTNGIHARRGGLDSLEQDLIPTLKVPYANRAGKYGFACIDGFAYCWDYEIRFLAAKSSTRPKALIIRDSFGDYLIPFLSQAFSESVFIFDAWQYRLHPEMIDSIQPDLVIFATIETNVSNLLKYSDSNPPQ